MHADGPDLPPPQPDFSPRQNDGREMPLGRVTPQAPDVERHVLGALMLDANAMVTASAKLKPEHFYVPRHALIYEAMLELHKENQPTDLLQVKVQLERMGKLQAVGNAAYLAELTQQAGNAANLEPYVHILHEKHLKREVIRISNEAVQGGYDPGVDAMDIYDKLQKEAYDARQGYLKQEPKPLKSFLKETLDAIEERQANPGQIQGVPTGFAELDEVMGGFQRSDFNIIAGRPGMGKTAFALSIARHAALRQRRPVAVFSLEMTSPQLVERMLAMEAEVPGAHMRNGRLQAQDMDKIVEAMRRLEASPLFLFDKPGLSIMELRAHCQWLKHQHSIEMVVIDYLQLLTARTANKNANREQEIALIARTLKQMAKDLNIPVIALSQLNRALEGRPIGPQKDGATVHKRPQVSDLRESGAIEQDADAILLLYRPEYYNIKQDEVTNENYEGICEVIIGKNRHGDTRTVNVGFMKELTKFYDLGPSGKPGRIVPMQQSGQGGDPYAGAQPNTSSTILPSKANYADGQDEGGYGGGYDVTDIPF